MATVTVTLRQEIIDGSGQSVKTFHATQWSVGKADLKMYWFKGMDGGSMQVNSNNILSIVQTMEDEGNYQIH